MAGSSDWYYVPQIDIANAPVCLACPLVECVEMLGCGDARRWNCPIYRTERERLADATRRYKEKKRLARRLNSERKPDYA